VCLIQRLCVLFGHLTTCYCGVSCPYGTDAAAAAADAVARDAAAAERAALRRGDDSEEDDYQPVMARHRTRDTPCFVCLTKCLYVVFGDLTPCYYSGGPYSKYNDEEEVSIHLVLSLKPNQFVTIHYTLNLKPYQLEPTIFLLNSSPYQLEPYLHTFFCY